MLLLSLVLAAAAPRSLALPALPGLPDLASPSFTPDGRSLLVVRAGPAGAKLYLVPVDTPNREKAIDVPGTPSFAALSHDGKSLAWLSDGELWVAEASGAHPRRLYPPAQGDAPLGTKLAHAAWAPDDAWLLIQSATGWLRVKADTGEVAQVALHPVDLAGGSVVLGGDGVHAAFVRPSSGPGWVNGARVIVANLETGQAQLADFDHDYVALLLLHDAQLAGEDGSGALWVLRGRSRLAYFTPPAVPANGSVRDWTLSLDGGRLAWIVGEGAQARLWVAAAPKPPPWPKPSERN